ncbi:MAG: flagellar motor switch protein FliM [Chthonomonadales bacterium]
MVEILSQSEIEALLSSLSAEGEAGEAPADGSASPSRAGARAGAKRDDRRHSDGELYDFRRPDKFSKDQLRTLQMVHEAFARLFASSLAAYLRVTTHVDLISVEQMPFDEYMRSVTNSVITIFSMPPLHGQALLEIEFNVVLAMIDRLLGGPGNMVKSTNVLTEIEKALTESITQRALKEFKSAWDGIAQIHPVRETLETQPQFVQIVPPNDIVVSVLFEIKVGDLRGAMSIAIPYIVLKPVSTKLSAQRWFSARKSGGQAAHVVARNLQAAPVQCICRLGTARITVRELLDLRPGDTVILDRKATDEADLLIGESVKFRGTPARSGRKLALHINRIVRDDTVLGASLGDAQSHPELPSTG